MFGLNIEQHRQKALVSKPCFLLMMATDLLRQQVLWHRLIHSSNVLTFFPENRHFGLLEYS